MDVSTEQNPALVEQAAAAAGSLAAEAHTLTDKVRVVKLNSAPAAGAPMRRRAATA